MDLFCSGITRKKPFAKANGFFQWNSFLRNEWNTLARVKLPAAVKYAYGVWKNEFYFTLRPTGAIFHNLRSKLFHRERKRTISLKANDYARVRIHTQKSRIYLFCSPQTNRNHPSGWFFVLAEKEFGCELFFAKGEKRSSKPHEMRDSISGRWSLEPPWNTVAVRNGR